MAVELAGSRSQERDQVGRVMKRVGDHAAVFEPQRSEEHAVDFGEQDRLRRRLGAGELR